MINDHLGYVDVVPATLGYSGAQLCIAKGAEQGKQTATSPDADGQQGTAGGVEEDAQNGGGMTGSER